MEITFLYIFLACLLFLCLGSSISAYAYRTPKFEEYLWRKEAHQLLALDFDEPAPASFTQGRSACPHCQHSLTIKDLIPLISFLLTRGRCRYCRQPIAWHYPMIEGLTLLACLPLIWIATSYVELMLLSVLFATLITISIIDWHHQWIPDQLNLILLGLSFLYILITPPLAFNDHIIAILVGYLFVVIIRALYLKLKKIEAIGLGDAKLLAALGAWQGLNDLFIIIFLASLFGILYALVTRANRHQTIAFGPFLAFASMALFIMNKVPVLEGIFPFYSLY